VSTTPTGIEPVISQSISRRPTVGTTTARLTEWRL